MTTHNTMNGTATKSTNKATTNATAKSNAKTRSNAKIPDAICTIEKVKDYRGTFYLLNVKHCPLCGKRHTHGGGDDLDHLLLGHREAHCFDDATPNKDRGYNLALTTEAK